MKVTKGSVYEISMLAPLDMFEFPLFKAALFYIFVLTLKRLVSAELKSRSI
jgi:hypothetical protein